MKKVLVVLCALTVGIAGCAGLTAREKGALVGGAAGASGGALLGAAAGNAMMGAAIGGPIGLLGGYLLGDHFFQDDAGRRTSNYRVGGYSTTPKAPTKSKGSASAASGKSPTQPQEDEERGRIF